MTKKETERNGVRKDEQGEREGTDIVGEKNSQNKVSHSSRGVCSYLG